ncbi:unnamed protein product [Soboliphyme baturini]|uniref:NTF2 domain-containing protein n=1 Tax=Soboliphyme baturini TaxID=241478 RepID=A0A183IWX7_9BILA|nr:unnamed protein product [Soboliphyme baturini]
MVTVNSDQQHDSRPETPKNPLTPQCVGREFVRQYYTLLGGVPDLMHRFYSNESVMLRGNDDEPTIGQMDISRKFSKMGIIDCYTRVRTVHSSETVAKGVVVQVDVHFLLFFLTICVLTNFFC